jgi:hypothetical protein
VHESLIPTTMIILKILFCFLKVLYCLRNFPKCYPIVYDRKEVRMVNHIQRTLCHKTFNGTNRKQATVNFCIIIFIWLFHIDVLCHFS